MKDDPLLWQLSLQVILILVNAVFASAEIALISLNTLKLQKSANEGDRRACRLLKLKSQPENFLATIQVGITLAGFLGSAFAADNFSEKLVRLMERFYGIVPVATLKTVSLIIITLIISFFTMVLGELVPKRLAMKKTEEIAYSLSFFLWLISKILSPAVWVLTNATRSLLYLFRLDPKAEEDTLTEEEIRLMVSASSEKGEIEESEKEIINNVFEFDDRIASDVMTHRLDTIMLSVKDDDAAWKKNIIENGYSYYPVCGETFDEVLGVLSTRDYLLQDDCSRKNIMEKAVHPALFVPHTLKTDMLLKKMKLCHNYFALVLDEYGGFTGVVSATDLVESLVGDLGFDDET
ncbi:MAG: hemolysin family protein [Spirochaetaceae bacterium]|jgi:putative hemolysin|nr:hemolysin family protein [Spirochaetaceae bacterium]